MSALTGVIGLVLGFFGVPSIITPPTARTVTSTETVTATATVTVTATPPAPDASDGDSPSPGSSARAANDVPLTDVEPLGSGYTNFERTAVTMGGKRFDNSIIAESLGFFESLTYSINERYKSLTVTVGLDDDSPAYPATVSFKSGGSDGKTLKSATAQINRPVEVTVDVTGVALLAIVTESNDGGPTLGLGNPMLHRS
ncbi:NPCBM/NEW2 domain-containing protein [Streptomyces sp. NPDC018352]|uniref:NPCBM/NEW2 domain-containing protein n=1 Tax=Streptomyces sp. NPDC018352 TaxID=3157194 RepID=UPI0033DDE246